MTEDADSTFDLIVVGAGPGGMAAALAARQAGSDVLLIEALHEIGGNAIWSTGYLAFTDFAPQHEAGVDDSVERFLEDARAEVDRQRDHYGIVWDEELTRRFIEGSGETYRILTGLGVEFGRFIPRPAQHSANRMVSTPDTFAFQRAFAGAFERGGVTVRLGTRVKRLATADGRVCGAVTEAGDTIRARAVILATGGYQAGAEVRRRYQPEYLANTPYLGVATCRGDGHVMGQAVGGDLINMTMVQPLVIAGSALVEDCVAVNLDGQRFHDECGPYDDRVDALDRQRDRRGFYVFDGATAEAKRHLIDQMPQPAVQAASLADLAPRIGVTAESLASSVAGWNAFLAGTGDRDPAFGRVVLPAGRPALVAHVTGERSASAVYPWGVQPTDILIANGTVIDGTGAAARAAMSVLLSGDRIVAVGPEATIAAQAGPNTVRIDATGKTVMPGLIDTHVHVTLGEPQSNDELFFHRDPAYSAILAGWQVQKLLRAGVTSAFDVDGIHHIGPALRDAIESGLVEGPRLVAGQHALLGAVGGTAGRLVPESGTAGYAEVVRTKDEIVQAVRRQIKFGADWIKIHVTGRIPGRPGELQVWSFDELKVACDTAHDLGIPVTAHCRTARSTRDSVLAGVDLILHASFLGEGTGAQNVGRESATTLREFDEAMAAILEHRTPICPTWTFLANLAEFGHKVGAGAAAMDLFRDEIEGTAARLRQAYEAGITFTTGSETGFSVTPVGQWHAREMELFVRYLGMSPLEAITCGTKNGAFAMKLEGRVGTIEAGMLADVLVVAGNPLEHIHVLQDRSRLTEVISRGNRVDLHRPYPQRKILSDEKVSNYSTVPLTWDLVNP